MQGCYAEVRARGCVVKHCHMAMALGLRDCDVSAPVTVRNYVVNYARNYEQAKQSARGSACVMTSQTEKAGV